MPRPTTKAELMIAAEEQFEKLWKLIDAMNDEEQNAPFEFSDLKKKEAHWERDKNLRDVIIHLYEWHQMVKRWYEEGTVKGGTPSVPGEGYTWQTLPDLNRKIWEAYQNVPLDRSKIMLKESHTEIMTLVEKHSDPELFEKGFYKWTKTTNLAAYLISCTSSHYEWAMTKIKLHIKNLRT